MKRTFTIILCLILVINLSAQTDTTEVKMMKKNVVTVVEDGKTTHVKVGNDKGIEVVTDDMGDTTHIRIGRRTFRVIEGGNGTYLKIDRDEKKKEWTGSFNPHWAGLEFGMNMYQNVDYSLYDQINIPRNFMDLHYGKSITVNLNFAEWAFKNEANNFGLVTGLGFSFMDFTFDQPLTIEKQAGDGIIIPRDLSYLNGLKKSKLNVSYLTAPLMLEVKTPLRTGSSRLYLAGGVIGGVNIGSHTKYKSKEGKEKTRSNFNLNQFKYDLTGRIGFGDFCVFVNYGMTPLYKENKGPRLHPVTIGFSFPNI